jgi:predicted DNA-binding transcriptional regulator YafY
MRRADRLFQIVQHLRARRLTTAAQLGEWLAVSPRTIYRDIRDLSLSGVPIEGEPGVGYRLSRGFDVPPIMFTFDEIEALVAGLRMVESWGGPSLALASRSALTKITLALPEARRASVEGTKLFAPNLRSDTETGRTLDTVRQSIHEQRRLSFRYLDAAGCGTDRVVRPLGLYYWGTAWTLASWCESRKDFRNFRLDRMRDLAITGSFPFVSGQALDDFLRAMMTRGTI